MTTAGQRVQVLCLVDVPSTARQVAAAARDGDWQRVSDGMIAMGLQMTEASRLMIRELREFRRGDDANIERQSGRGRKGRP